MQPDVKTIATDHKDLIHDVAYDYYGDRLATCSSDHTIKIWEKNIDGEWEKTSDIRGHQGSVWRVTWAHPEFGSVLASCSFDRTAAVWEEMVTVSGDNHKSKVWSRRHLCVDSRSSVTDVKFAPKNLGLILATCSYDGVVRLYEAPDVMNITCWSPLHEIDVKMNCSCLSWCSSMSIQPIIAVGCDDSKQEGLGKVVLYSLREDLSTYMKIGSVDSIKDPVQDVSFAPNLGRSTNMLAIASKGVTLIQLKQISTADGQPQFDEVLVAQLYDKMVWRISWNVTGTTLAFTSDDGYIRTCKSNYLGEWKIQNTELRGDGSIQERDWRSQVSQTGSSSHISTHRYSNPAL